MPTIKAVVNLPDTEFAFYQPPRIGEHANPGRRLKGGTEFALYYDDEHPLFDGVVNGKKVKGQCGKNYKLLEEVKKKSGPKKKVDDGDNELRDSP